MNSVNSALTNLKNDLLSSKEIASFIELQNKVLEDKKYSKKIEKLYKLQTKMMKSKENKKAFIRNQKAFFKFKNEFENDPIIANLNSLYFETTSLLSDVKEMII